MNDMISTMIADLQTSVIPVDATNWYWIVGGSSTQVYSSKSNTYVPLTDANYVAWTGAGNVASPIAVEADIWPCVSAFMPAWLFNGTTFSQPTPTTYTKAQLATYSANARYNHAYGGVIITSLSPVEFMTDVVSRNTINSAYDYLNVNTAATVHWKMSDGSFVLLDHTKMTTLNNDVSNFVQSCFTCESNTLASINSGSITTTAAIDSAYAAISNTFP
jgi:hypothetical protein